MDTKLKNTNCDSCEYFDYDEYSDTYCCIINLDEDEAVKFLTGTFKNCPYYKFYDEYKTVQKQN